MTLSTHLTILCDPAKAATDDRFVTCRTEDGREVELRTDYVEAFQREVRGDFVPEGVVMTLGDLTHESPGAYRIPAYHYQDWREARQGRPPVTPEDAAAFDQACRGTRQEMAGVAREGYTDNLPRMIGFLGRVVHETSSKRLSPWLARNPGDLEDPSYTTFRHADREARFLLFHMRFRLAVEETLELSRDASQSGAEEKAEFREALTEVILKIERVREGLAVEDRRLLDPAIKPAERGDLPSISGLYDKPIAELKRLRDRL